MCSDAELTCSAMFVAVFNFESSLAGSFTRHKPVFASRFAPNSSSKLWDALTHSVIQFFTRPSRCLNLCISFAGVFVPFPFICCRNQTDIETRHFPWLTSCCRRLAVRRQVASNAAVKKRLWRRKWLSRTRLLAFRFRTRHISFSWAHGSRGITMCEVTTVAHGMLHKVCAGFPF